MNFKIKKQESYSRGELLLRSFLGVFYILLPHYLVMIVYAIIQMFMSIWTFYSILFTRKYPKKAFDFFVKLQRYYLRLNSTLFNMQDGYPSFSLDAKQEYIEYSMTYKPTIKRRVLLIRLFFGGILIIPHIFVLYFRLLGLFIVQIIVFFSILFTKNFPDNMFKFSEETLRYLIRVGNYFRFYTEGYPPFHGRVLHNENKDIDTLSSSDHLIVED